MIQHPSASFAFTARCRILNRPGMLGQLTSAIGELGGDIRGLDIVRVDRGAIVRDITVLAADEDHAQQLVEMMKTLAGVEVLDYSDRTFLAHLGGKIEVVSRTPIRTREDLSMVYTPGVARISMAIAADHSRARNLTIKRNSVAIVTDGSAVLGLGNIGPEAAIPVMEGKAMLFKEFGKVDAFPICLATQDIDEIVATVVNIAPVFGGINLEDIAGPRCFEVEERLSALLDIPVFHDDQHGTAVVVLAALLNALEVVSKRIDDIRVVCLGVGAAGTAVTKLLLAAGVTDVVGVDRAGIIHARLAESATRIAGTPPTPIREASAAHSRTRCRAPTCSSAPAARPFSSPRSSRRWPTCPSSSRWPTRSRRFNQRRSRGWLRSSPPVAATTPTRSTTCSASRVSSAGCSTAAPNRSPMG